MTTTGVPRAFRGPAGVCVEADEIGFVQARRGGERGERGDVGLHLAVEGEREGLGGVGQALLEGGAVVPGHAPSGRRTESERGQQAGEHEGGEVRPEAAALRPGGRRWCRHSAPPPARCAAAWRSAFGTSD